MKDKKRAPECGSNDLYLLEAFNRQESFGPGQQRNKLLIGFSPLITKEVGIPFLGKPTSFVPCYYATTLENFTLLLINCPNLLSVRYRLALNSRVQIFMECK